MSDTKFLNANAQEYMTEANAFHQGMVAFLRVGNMRRAKKSAKALLEVVTQTKDIPRTDDGEAIFNRETLIAQLTKFIG